jgi:hypothetical protein
MKNIDYLPVVSCGESPFASSAPARDNYMRL